MASKLLKAWILKSSSSQRHCQVIRVCSFRKLVTRLRKARSGVDAAQNVVQVSLNSLNSTQALRYSQPSPQSIKTCFFLGRTINIYINSAAVKDQMHVDPVKIGPSPAAKTRERSEFYIIRSLFHPAFGRHIEFVGYGVKRVCSTVSVLSGALQ